MDAVIGGLNFFMSEPTTFLFIIFGVFFGIIFGCIPGLTATLAVIIMIPLTFILTSELGISLLIGVYVGGISGGLISAILLNIPGTPSSMVTTWDGYQMAKKGFPGTAISLGVFCSMIGGLFSAIVLLFVAPPLSILALKFGSWEYLALMLLGMTVVVKMTSKSPIKGLMSAFFGILIATIGLDGISGASRLTFGFWQLQGGIAVVSVSMAFFAVREILQQVKDFGSEENLKLKNEQQKVEIKDKITVFPTRKTLKNTGPAFGIGAIYGTLVGMLPGVGQTAATMLAYGSVRQVSKHPEKFGTGIPEGIVAAETANNAVCGGALIPLLTLGIPGDMVTSVLIGGLMIQGIQVGPLLFRTDPQIVGTIMIAYFLANIIMFVMELGFIRGFVRISKTPLSFLFPIILMFAILGVFARANRVFDIWILVIFGIIGYFLSECRVPMPPLILGYILGNMIEKTLRTAMYSSRGDIMVIFTRPIAITFLAIGVILLSFPYISPYLKGRFFQRTN